MIPDHLKTRGMCAEAVRGDPYSLQYVPDPLKIQEICIIAAAKDPGDLVDIPDWFVRLELVEMWVDDKNCDDNELAEWYSGYKKRKT